MGDLSLTDRDLTLYAKIVERAKEQGDVVTASITYSVKLFGVEKTGLGAFPSDMLNGVTLPTEYIEGETISIPKLKNYQESEKVIYKFEGWFYDKKP